MDDALFRASFNAIGTVQEMAIRVGQSFEAAADDLRHPHVYMRPRVFLDSPGTWCCMLGECLATAPAGFGSSPDAACRDFDRRWLWSQAQIDEHDAKATREAGEGTT